MKNTSTRVLAGFLISLLALGGGLWFWRSAVIVKRTALANTTIQNGLSAADFVSARSALPGIADPALRAAKEREIRVGELKSALAVRDTGLLRLAIGSEGSSWMDPKLLEAADLDLAREAVQSRDFEGYQKFAGKWQAKSSFPGQWTLLEADQLLARKKPEEALQTLKAARLDGPEDALRHARLALLEAKQPWNAMTTIDEGLKADPMNADLLSFRAQIEEAAGRIQDARLDYVAAVLSERKNPLHREILANFSLRRGDLQAAAETWRDAAEDTGLGIYALKSWFWSRVSGIRLTKPLAPCRQQGWRELIAALATTPDDVFWDASLEVPLATIRGGSERPEVTWLRLLELLRNQDLKSAKTRLESGFPREAVRLWPNLSSCLLAELAAREGLNPRLPLAGRDLPPTAEGAHPFLVEFSRWAQRTSPEAESKRLEAWLARPNAIIGTLFASGWSGAALILGGAGKLVLDADSPDWFDYGYASSLLLRDGKDPARKWLETLPTRSTSADLLLGELQLTSGAVEQGLLVLGKIAAGQSPHASRAAWTLALAELDRGNSAKAREIALAAPALAAGVQGKEILARCALAEGRRAETLRIYQELGEQSVDAMIFLSKEAFAGGDFEQARQWTAKLAQRFPEQPSFRQNLIKIDAAEKLKKP